MKYKISRYKYEKVLQSDIEIDIPEVPEYHFQTGIRRSIAIVPEWTTWNKEQFQKEEEVWLIKFICIYGGFYDKIEMTGLQLVNISQYELSKRDESSIIDFFLYRRDEYTKRTEEQFMADYNNVIKNFNQTLSI